MKFVGTIISKTWIDVLSLHFIHSKTQTNANRHSCVQIFVLVAVECSSTASKYVSTYSKLHFLKE